MKFTVVNVGTVGNATGATLTLTATVPAGATIFICVTEKSTSGTDGTISDGGVNTYSKLTSGSLAATAADGRGILWAVTKCAALSSATITYTRNLSGSAAAMSVFYVEGATGAATFTGGLTTATGTTGTITVTSGSLGAGDLALGVLFDSGSSATGGNATFTQAAGFATPPNEIKSGAGAAQARVDGGTAFKSASGTQVYAPTMSSTAQQWFLVVLGIIPAPDSAISLDRPALPRPTPWPFDPPNLLLTTLKPPPVVDTTHILRAPIFARLPDARSKAQAEYVVNLLPVQAPVIGPPYNFFRPPLIAPMAKKPTAAQEYVFNRSILLYPPPVVTVRFIHQDDWPLPTRASAKSTGEALGTLNPLLTPNPAKPFVESDWPRPFDPKAKAVGEAVAGIAPILTPNPVRPFNQALWDSATRSYPKATGEVVGTLSPVFTPNPTSPFNQYEWRLPARVPLSLKSDVYWGAFSLYSPNPPIPFNQDLWESATRGYPKATGDAVAGIAPLLTPNPAQPFVQSDWFQIRSIQKAKVDDPYNATIIQPAFVVAKPFYYYDDGVRSVPAARTPPKAVGEAVSGVSPLLTPNPAQPFVESIWDSATRAYPKAVGEAVGTLSPLLTPNPARPFVQSDWLRQPALPKAIGEPLAAISALYNPNPARPFSQYQWDLATRAWPKAVGEAVGEINVLFTPNPAKPFNQSEWPAIRFGRKALVDDPYNLTVTLPVTVRYIHQDDWQLPALPRAPQKSDVYGAIRSLYSPNPARPFIQADWPRPTDAIKLKAVGEPIGRVTPILTPNPVRPFVQSDWFQIRTSQKAKIDDFLNLFPLHAPVVVGKPFSQGDWPLAARPQNYSDKGFGSFNPNIRPNTFGTGGRRPLLTQAMGVISGGGGGGVAANFWPDMVQTGGVGPPHPTSGDNWILANGFWNDAGVWIDSDFWMDGP